MTSRLSGRSGSPGGPCSLSGAPGGPDGLLGSAGGPGCLPGRPYGLFGSPSGLDGLSGSPGMSLPGLCRARRFQTRPHTGRFWLTETHHTRSWGPLSSQSPSATAAVAPCPSPHMWVLSPPPLRLQVGWGLRVQLVCLSDASRCSYVMLVYPLPHPDGTDGWTPQNAAHLQRCV